MGEGLKKGSVIKKFITLVIVVIVISTLLFGAQYFRKSIAKSYVKNGTLMYEETADGYIIRDEIVLEGQNYKNGMVQVVSDGKRASKGETVFRYLSANEEGISAELATLDMQINNEIEKNNINLLLSDITSIEKQIEATIDDMYDQNDLFAISENKNKLESYMVKKAEITGNESPSDSTLRTLTTQRNVLEQRLINESEIVNSPVAGVASYRVDGLESILSPSNFNNLSKKMLDELELKVGTIIPQNTEKGKIVNNFESYIATSIDSEIAFGAKIGDKVTLRISNGDEINSEVFFIKDEDNSRIIVFKINQDIEKLLEYRKITFDIVWWKYTGLKVSNQAIVMEDDDKTYIYKIRNGKEEKVLVKVLRQNDTYSIIENYKEEELKNMNYTDKEIENRSKIYLYDEVINF